MDRDDVVCGKDKEMPRKIYIVYQVAPPFMTVIHMLSFSILAPYSPLHHVATAVV